MLDGAYLVLDVLRSDKEHIYDSWFHGVPDRSNGLEGIQLDMKPLIESLGEVDGYEMVNNLSSSVIESDFGCDWLVSGIGTKIE